MDVWRRAGEGWAKHELLENQGLIEPWVRRYISRHVRCHGDLRIKHILRHLAVPGWTKMPVHVLTERHSLRSSSIRLRVWHLTYIHCSIAVSLQEAADATRDQH